jgi:RHS repeat-associated protein
MIQQARRLGQNAVRDEDNVNLGPMDDYTWDEENRMVQCRVRGEITAYTYDYNGDRTNKNNPHGETIYVSEFFQIQHNLTGTKHIYVGNNRLAVKLMRYRQPNNYNECRFEDQVIHDNDYEKKGFYVLHSDHLGSSNVVTDYQGNQFQHLEYMPYGESWVEEGQWNDFLRIKYNGKEQDPETNMYYYGARYLDPMFSRWVSPDPGMQGVNWYQYCNSNPINYLDPDGKEWLLNNPAWEFFNEHVVEPINDLEQGAREALSFEFSLIPGVNDAKDVQECVTGKDLITEKSIPASDRLITAVGAALPIVSGKALRTGSRILRRVGLGAEAIEYATKSEKRLQHAYKHAHQLDLGFGGWNNATKSKWKGFISNVLTTAEKSFDNELGGIKVKGYLKMIDGKPIAVYVYKEGPYKGEVATVVKLSKNQLEKFGLLK